MNDLTDLMPKILAMALEKLRGALIMPMAVNRDFSPEPQTRGRTIDIPLPLTLATRTVSPSVTPVAAPGITPKTTPLTLDQWEEVPIAFTDKDRVEVSDNATVMAVEAAVDALAERVNATAMALYKDVYNVVGTPATTPFGSNYAEATAARRVLNANKVRPANRRMLIDVDAEANAVNLAQFADASFSGSPGVIVEGNIGRKVGFDWAFDQQVPSHANGAGSGYLVNTAAHAVGDTTIPVDTGSGTLVAGTIFQFGAYAKTFVLTADLTAAGNASFSPALDATDVAAISNNDAITPTASHVANLAFHRDAFAIAIRGFRKPASAATVLQMVDEKTNLPLRLEVMRQNKQDYWSLDLLWGVKTLRPELAVRVAG